MQKANKLSPLSALYIALFLSTFVDNMILFVANAIIKNNPNLNQDYYLPFVQAMFLANFIIFSPWVGRFADKHAKANVLIIGIIIKSIGVLLFFLGMDPAFNYSIIGMGAVVYSPAKYGILPFLTNNETELLQSNSDLEIYTIIAILTGSVTGGFIADHSIPLALVVCFLLYSCSILVTLLIPKDAGNPSITFRHSVREFFADVNQLCSENQSRYCFVGTGSFWMTSSVLRVIMFSWAPLAIGSTVLVSLPGLGSFTLDLTQNSSISLIFSFTGIGIVMGALVAPKIISIKTYYKSVWFGFAMALTVLSFVIVRNFYIAIFLLLLIGTLGGIFSVPLNATLQQIGHNTIGSGKTIAIQNFIENNFMFMGVGAYTLAQKGGILANTSICTMGLILLAMILFMYTQSKTKI